MQNALEVLLAVVALYPVTTAALWVAGGILFRLLEERPGDPLLEPEGGWPGVSILIPAYNEEAVIATCVRAALKSDYPRFEVLVLDDGSTDETEAAANEAGAGDSRLRVLRDPVNRGKAEQLNVGFARARHELVMVTDADTHMHPRAIRYLVARIESSPVLAAVAGGPLVTNRDGLLCVMQVLESAAIIGLVRRTQSLTGRVGIVAGVLGLFHRDRVQAVGGYDGRMATEDIDLTWRLLMAGWQTAYEPRAVVGMQVPSALPALWAQRKRWARGQGEVLRVHMRELLRWRNHRMWLLGLESVISLTWVFCLMCSLALTVLNLVFGHRVELTGAALAWGAAISIVATMQLFVAVWLRRPYDHWGVGAMMFGPIYTLLFWIVSAAAAVDEQIIALIRGPREQRVVWDIPREPLDSTSP